jgi:23S rRNA pseudouridine2605 synthase
MRKKPTLSKQNPTAGLRREPLAVPRKASAAVRHGLARVMSKLGICSRTQAQKLLEESRVRVNGRVVRDAQAPVDMQRDRIELDGAVVAAAEKVYLALNKPRGYVTTANDEKGRDTVYELLREGNFPWLAPVGRLDKASEGLLLFSNDSEWAARLTDPSSHLDKTYHVQIDALPDADLLQRIRAGVADAGQRLAAKSVHELRRGEKHAWLEIVLDEGRNRQIRRLLAAFDLSVLRLVRVAIGSLQLGDLPKGKWEVLTARDLAALR